MPSSPEANYPYLDVRPSLTSMASLASRMDPIPTAPADGDPYVIYLVQFGTGPRLQVCSNCGGTSGQCTAKVCVNQDKATDANGFPLDYYAATSTALDRFSTLAVIPGSGQRRVRFYYDVTHNLPRSTRIDADGYKPGKAAEFTTHMADKLTGADHTNLASSLAGQAGRLVYVSGAQRTGPRGSGGRGRGRGRQ